MSVDTHQHGKVRFFIIADDLTGACDSAVAFAERGRETEVLPEGGAKSSVAEVLAISTDSRDISEGMAAQRVRNSLTQAGETCEVFKKVDSVFRGNSFAEIHAALTYSSCELAVMSPAYPSMGRIVKDGVLQIIEAGCKRTIDLRESLAAVGIHDVSVIPTGSAARAISEGMRDALQAGKKLVLCDAKSSEDLQLTVAAARRHTRDILWIGSGGLAHALASELPKVNVQEKDRIVDGPAVLFVGSDHVVTRRQIEVLKQIASVLEASVEEFEGSGTEHQFVVLNITRNSTTGDQIRRAMSALPTHAIACGVLTGGDTAALVCRALGVRSLRLHEEFAPGLPLGTVIGGVLDGVPVILKSGGFGKDDALCGLLDRFAKRKEFA
jgi:uncharacterized protein YgbK (DUF1537 family)